METITDTAAAEWFAGPLGSRVLREENALARIALEDVFGFESLQLGAWGAGSADLLAGARTQHATLVAPRPGPGVSLLAPLTSLPFRSDSLDAVLLPHTLELVADPYAVLREAERVLCAEGALLICGFNPFSGWGARRLFARGLGRPSFPPLSRRLLSERRLRDWMALLDFEVASVYGYLGALPLTAANAEYRPRPSWAAGAYLLKARKRVQSLTLVRPRRRARRLVLVPATEPAAQVA